jgi:hypothetical protein
MESLARLLVILGLILIVVGGILFLFSRIGVPLGRLPGDIRVESGNMTCLIGLGTSLLLSVLLTVIINIVLRMLDR